MRFLLRSTKNPSHFGRLRAFAPAFAISRSRPLGSTRVRRWLRWRGSGPRGSGDGFCPSNSASTNSSGSNSRRSSTRSPTPMYRTGMRSWSAMPRMTPPLAVPSSLVRTMPLTAIAWVKIWAWAMAFWPEVASMTSQVSWGAPSWARPSTRRTFCSSSIRSVLVCSRPAVSAMTTWMPSALARLTASKITEEGSEPSLPRTTGTPTRPPQTSSCSVAAARKVSPAASSTVRPSPRSWAASLPMVVVLPLPLTPMTSRTNGSWARRSPPARRPRSGPRDSGAAGNPRPRSARPAPCGRASLGRRSSSFWLVRTPMSAVSSTFSSSSTRAGSICRRAGEQLTQPRHPARPRPGQAGRQAPARRAA